MPDRHAQSWRFPVPNEAAPCLARNVLPAGVTEASYAPSEFFLARHFGLRCLAEIAAGLAALHHEVGLDAGLNPAGTASKSGQSGAHNPVPVSAFTRSAAHLALRCRPSAVGRAFAGWRKRQHGSNARPWA